MRTTCLRLLLCTALLALGCSSDDDDAAGDDDAQDDDAQDDDAQDDDVQDDDSGDDDNYCNDALYTDDDAYEDHCDDDFTDDDSEGCEGDDDTAGGTWLAQYEGFTRLELTIDGSPTTSLLCGTTAEMSGNIGAFHGSLDCGDPALMPTPLVLSGDKEVSSSCIDGRIDGAVTGIGSVDWFWMGSISPGKLTGSFRIETQEYMAEGLLCAPVLPIWIGEVYPASGDIAGGYDVTLRGNFLASADELHVCFGDNPASVTSVIGKGWWGAYAEVTAPAGDAAAPVDVKAWHSSGSDVLPGGFEYTQ